MAFSATGNLAISSPRYVLSPYTPDFGNLTCTSFAADDRGISSCAACPFSAHRCSNTAVADAAADTVAAADVAAVDVAAGTDIETEAGGQEGTSVYWIMSLLLHCLQCILSATRRFQSIKRACNRDVTASI